MRIFLTADIGSTFTKVTAVDIEDKKIIGCARSFTTIETNVMEGFENALEELSVQCGKLTFEKKVASSSAAGGLKMIAVGLVPDLTVKASKLAVTNAGAKILKTYSYELSIQEQEEIYQLNPDMVLLSGGIDGGNKEVIIHNAKVLARIDRNFSIVVAGNKSAVDEIGQILRHAGKQVVLCENVMPEFNKLNIDSAKKAIRDLFIKNIISAKGLDNLQSILATEIIPTPLSVFDAACLLSRGTKTQAGLDELMIFDVGGATTDVYSMSDGYPSRPNVFVHGIQDPFAKRTVEGDLGMRYSILPLVEEAGIEQIARHVQTDEATILNWLDVCQRAPDTVPEIGSLQKQIDDEFAAMAIKISAARHCGFVETVFTSMGEALSQTGKDLTQVKYVIGTGGSVINSAKPEYILGKALYQPADLNLLKPLTPTLLLDKKYILSSMGLLSKLEPDVALSIMKEELLTNGHIN
ncbi:methylaspartate mutase accessory protein GlmL [Neisseria sp. Ec49-e6-T10]|uniref:methylaspartate mutase accessory protein GlmL n=1 Tax=Neisseria sp. Ec49-e6-T10 TaxID=3140744 RepID=UPI003EBC6D42